MGFSVNQTVVADNGRWGVIAGFGLASWGPYAAVRFGGTDFPEPISLMNLDAAHGVRTPDLLFNRKR